MNYGVRSSRRS